MWYYYWHRLVGTAGAWFFWCGSTPTPNPSSIFAISAMVLALALVPFVYVDCVRCECSARPAVRCMSVVCALGELLVHVPLVCMRGWREQPIYA